MKTRVKTSPALFATFALLVTAPAQEPEKAAPFRFVPAGAQFVARIAAPAQWQQRFADTKVAAMLRGEALAPWINKLRAGYEQGLEAARAEGKVDVDAMQRFVSDYRGEMVVAMQLDLDDLKKAMADDRPPRLSVSFTLTPDGTFDLATFAETLTKAIEEHADVPITDLVIGDHRLRASTQEQGVSVTVPAMIDGHLVMLIGADLATEGARLLATGDRMAVAGDGAPLWVHGDLKGLMAALIAFASERGEEEGAPVDIGQLLRDLGLGAVESLSTSLKPNGDRVEWEFALGTAAENRGLMDMFPPDPVAARMLRWLAAGVDTYSTSPFDLGALFGTVQKVWNGLGDEVPITFDDAMASFAEMMKVRLKEDLLDHVGGGLMSLQDMGSATDFDAMQEAAEENPFGAMFNACYVLGLRDGKAFAASLETLLRARGLHAARKSEDYQGTKIHLLRLAGLIEVEYAVTDDLLLIAAGSDETPRQHLRGVLDARREGGSAELPAKVAPYVAALPKGWHGLSVSPIAKGLAGAAQALEMLQQTGEFPEGEVAGQVLEVMRTIGGELERADLGTMVGATYIDARRIAVRVLW